jgi:hypothetical protein
MSLHRLLLTLPLALPLAGTASAALSLSALHTPAEAGFSGFTAPAVWATTAPGAGQLDSNRWAINADGPLTSTPAVFGGELSGGLGTSTGSESAAGVYAFDVGGGVTALGVQPTASFWTPGMFTLRLDNDTGVTITSLQVEWTTWHYNDQGRSNSLRFLHSADNTAFMPAPSEFDLLSPEAASPAPVAWQGTSRSLALTGLHLPEGAAYYLRWGGDDVGGSGSRDELALSGVRITPVPEPTVLGFLALGSLCLLARRR